MRLQNEKVSNIFAALEKDQQFFVELNGNIAYEIFNSEFKKLVEDALKQKEQGLISKLKR